MGERKARGKENGGRSATAAADAATSSGVGEVQAYEEQRELGLGCSEREVADSANSLVVGGSGIPSRKWSEDEWTLVSDDGAVAPE